MSARRQADRVRYRLLARADLERIRDIDRTERIDTLYVQRGAELRELRGDWSAPAWLHDGEGEHSVAAQQRACADLLDAGATALGAFDGGRLVAVGIVRPHLRSGIAQLAYLHVSNGYRDQGIGGHIAEELEQIARAGGDATIVVSATPSLNTVRFYAARGFEPMAEPLPELFELEPEDVHMSKAL